MAAGFNAPGITFLNTWDAPEREFLAPVFKSLHSVGNYTRMVEPCAGAFVMPGVAVELGHWKPGQIECSDISLYTSVIGYMCAGKDLVLLDVQVDNEPLPLRDDLVDDAAQILHRQAELRFERMPDNLYWQEMRRDLKERRNDFIVKWRDDLQRLKDRFDGIEYEAEDVWDHLARVKDDPKTVVSINPPTYAGGFEKFFDTKGRMTWAEPDYKVFDAAVDIETMMDYMADAEALMLTQQQQVPGGASARPIHARHLDRNQYVYIISNRPDEVEEVVGLSAVTKTMPLSESLDISIIPQDHEITEDSSVAVAPIMSRNTRYYRDLWSHKLGTKQAAAEYMVIVDGYLAGIGGYDTQTLDRPFNDTMEGCLILTYALGSPHKRYRLTRLVTQLGLCRQTIDLVLPPWAAVRTERLVTVEFTRHPEAKGLRGLMKLHARTDDKVHGNKLTYYSPVREEEPMQSIKMWLGKERQSKKAREEAKSV